MLKFAWFDNGKEFALHVRPSTYRAYLTAAKKAANLFELMEAKAAFVASVLSESSEAKISVELTFGQVHEAFDAIEAETFPGPRLCAGCRATVVSVVGG